MPKRYAGIDPGKKGHIAVINEYGAHLYDYKMPYDGKVLDCHKVAGYLEGVDGVALERVWAMPSSDGGKRAMGASSAFTFGMGYGGLLSVLQVIAVPFVNPTPQAWQRAIIGGRVKGQSTKEMSRRVAAERHEHLAARFLKVKASADFADALLMAEFARQTFLLPTNRFG